MPFTEQFDVVVVGAGHAGCEAAMAAARMGLKTSRGPAVWSPRAQCDKQAYRLKMREVLESQPNLKIKQAEVADLIVEALQLSAVGAVQDGSTSNPSHPEWS